MKKVLCSLFITSVLFFSCTEDQNFDQADDFSVIPTVATSVFFFESPEDVINAQPTGIFFVQTFAFNAFSEAFVSDRILDGTITYQLDNTTSKDLNLLVEFIDADDNVLDSESFTIPQQPAPLLERQVAYGNGNKNLDILRNTASIRVTSENLSDNTSESTANEPRIILRSSAAFRVELQ